MLDTLKAMITRRVPPFELQDRDLGTVINTQHVRPFQLDDGRHLLVSRTQRCQGGGHDDSCELDCIWGFRVLGTLHLAADDHENEA